MNVSKQAVAAVEQYLADHRDDLISDLQALVAIPSKKEESAPGLPFGKPCADALDLALRQAARLGFDIHNLDNYVGWAEMGEGEEMLGILAHLDVVPEGDGWSVPPYSGVVKDGLIWGRGTQDDKGPALIALYAMAAVKAAGLAPNKRVRLILGCDEESGSACLEHYIEHAELPTIAFSPDAEYPVVNGEKGMLRLCVSADYEEQKEGKRILSISGGDRCNIVPPTCQAVLHGVSAAEARPVCDAVAKELSVSISCSEEGEVLTLSLEGKGAHAAMPEKGNSAVTAMLTLLLRLPLAPCAALEKLSALLAAYPHHETDGSSAGCACADEVSGPMTLNLGLFQFQPAHFEAVLDIRYPIHANHEDIVANMRKTVPLSIQVQSHMVPHYVDPQSDLVQGLLRAYTDCTGLPGECIAIGGGTYARHFKGGVSFGCVLPTTVDNMHQADEALSLEEMMLNARIMAHAILELCF